MIEFASIVEKVQIVFPASSGPFWGLVGVAGTQVLNLYLNRRKAASDNASSYFSAINAGSKQLTDGLFQQVKMLQEQVTTLTSKSEDCERRHDAANDALRAATVRVAILEHDIDALTTQRVARRIAKEPRDITPPKALPAPKELD